jgi:ComF family protein
MGSLCGDCLSRFAAPVPRCARCGIRLGVAAPACGDCLAQPPPYRQTVCAVDYGFPWSGVIAEFKFRQQPEWASALAGLLQAAVQAGMQRTVGAAQAPANQPALPQAVLPVPLAPGRLAERGYNQAWELARRVAAGLGLTARADVLLRPLDSDIHQAQLDRASRQRQLQGSFMVAPAARPALQGLHLALVDDVMTTGSTAAAAAAALLQAGAGRVDLWVLARTPAPDAAADA